MELFKRMCAEDARKQEQPSVHADAAEHACNIARRGAGKRCSLAQVRVAGKL